MYLILYRLSLGTCIASYFIIWTAITKTIQFISYLVFPLNFVNTACQAISPPFKVIIFLCTRSTVASPAEDIWIFYRISLFYYGTIGTFLAIVVGLAVSHLTGPHKLGDIHPNLLNPMVHKYLPKTEYAPLPLKNIKEEVQMNNDICWITNKNVSFYWIYYFNPMNSFSPGGH